MRYIQDIWKSFRALPLWVQIWVAAGLVPVNLAALAFLDQGAGWIVAVLAIGPVLVNTGVMLLERGFSRAMALPHIPGWGLLVVWILWLLLRADMPGGAFRNYLQLLLLVDAVSLGFDVPDALQWWRGDRGVAGRA